MADLFTLQNLFTLIMLLLLQAVLGFDNLLYIAIESKRVQPDKQRFVRRTGIIIAIGLRIVLLFVIMSAINTLTAVFFEFDFPGIATAEFNFRAFITLVGGAFIIYTAVKEIMHLLAVHDIGHDAKPQAKRSVTTALVWIISMNLIFSVDSILSALALTQTFIIMATAIVLSGILMVVLADYVAEFLKKNRMYEVMGLFILFIVGILLVSEGAHLAHLELFGYKIEAMAKSTFYFVVAVLIVSDVVASTYQKRLMARKAAEVNDPDFTTEKSYAASAAATKGVPAEPVG
ncbi:MAG: tellurium resistance protein TerC [Pseudomonadota bacterium]